MKKETRTARGTGSIYQKNGYYVAQVFDGYKPNGTPKYRQAQRKLHADAVKALKELQAKVTMGIEIPDGRACRLSEWLETWLNDHVKPNKEPKTYDFYKLNVDKRIAPLLGKMEIRKVRATDVTRFFRQIEQNGSSKSTISATRRTLRAAFSVAVKQGLCVANPVSDTTAPTVRTKAKVYFDAVQAQSLLKALQGSAIENLVRFTLATGLRVGEATGLTWDNVDLNKNQFTVTQQLQRIEGELRLKALKTEKSRRTMPLVGHSLQAVRDEKAKQTLEDKPNPLGLVFLNPLGRPFDPKYIDARLKEALKAAELPPTGMHSLRHSAATFMLMAGLNMHQVSRYLGHSQIGLTSNLYGHVLDESMREAADALQRAYASK
jgi:integrase